MVEHRSFAQAARPLAVAVGRVGNPFERVWLAPPLVSVPLHIVVVVVVVVAAAVAAVTRH